MDLNTDTSAKPKKVSRNRNKLNPRLPRMGKVVFTDAANAVHCTVKGFTEDKAVLTMSGWMGLPSEFTLYIEPDNIRTSCRIAKRRGSNIEVQFLEVEYGIRYRAL